MTDRKTRESGWEQQEEEQARSFLRSTPQQRLEWLEEAQRFVWEAGAWPAEETRPGD